ncbi:MAG: archaeosortase A [Thermoplasmata archaeon]|nr:archaeosortase A [Thermoplasmata archaeon]
MKDGWITSLLFVLPSSMLIIGFIFFPFPLSPQQHSLLLIPLFVSLFLLFVGYLRGSKGKLSRFFGWIIFAFYWSTQPSSLYFYENGDIVNALICTAGVYVLVYFAYKEIYSNAPCLRWLAGTASISGLIYFTLENIPALRNGLINLVAYQSAFLLSIFSDRVMVDGDMIWYGKDYDLLLAHGSAPTAEIIFACTAIQSILFFVGMICSLNSKPSSKIHALLLTVPTIYVLNLFRNACIIFLSGSRIVSMNIAHNYIGKTGSLIALIILLFLTFKILPELNDQLSCVFDLPKVEGPAERFIKGRIVRR